ncbi:MAG: hypothetical protein AAF170_16385 [Bacteroidota bacterium]
MSDAPIDRAAEALARRLLNDLPARQPVARAAFDQLPPPVAQLLHARLNARVDRETARPATPWIDGDHSVLREAQTAWREAIRSAAQVPVDAWEDTLADATHRAIAHLVQPAATLAATAFADELASPDPLPTPLVLDRLRAFGPYPYLIEIVERYVEKKGLGHIDRDGLERLLLRIDSRMVAGFSADEWVALLDPLFALLDGHVSAPLLQLAFEARGQGSLVTSLEADSVSREALHTHLKAATTESADAPAPTRQPVSVPAVSDPADGAPLEADAHTRSPAEAPSPHASVPELAPEPEPEPLELTPDPADRPPTGHTFDVEPRRPTPPVISSKFNAPEEVAPDDSDVLGPARPVEIVEAMTPMAPLSAPSASITDAIVTETVEERASTDDEPLWKRLADPADSDSNAPASPSDTAPLWAQFSQDAPAPLASSMSSTTAPPLPSVSAPDLVSTVAPPVAEPALHSEASLATIELAVLGASDTDRRVWYTDELFSGNAEDYEATLRQLDAARTWTEATDIIARDVFRKHSVNIYSDPAVTFTDAVEGQMEAR